MQHNYKFCLIAGLAILVAAPVSFAQISSATVTGGQIAGVVSGGGATFQGIPFAAPPTGELRWKAPQPVVAWQGVHKAARSEP